MPYLSYLFRRKSRFEIAAVAKKSMNGTNTGFLDLFKPYPFYRVSAMRSIVNGTLNPLKIRAVNASPFPKEENRIFKYNLFVKNLNNFLKNYKFKKMIEDQGTRCVAHVRNKELNKQSYLTNRKFYSTTVVSKNCYTKFSIIPSHTSIEDSCLNFKTSSKILKYNFVKQNSTKEEALNDQPILGLSEDHFVSQSSRMLDPLTRIIDQETKFNYFLKIKKNYSHFNSRLPILFQNSISFTHNQSRQHSNFVPLVLVEKLTINSNFKYQNFKNLVKQSRRHDDVKENHQTKTKNSNEYKIYTADLLTDSLNLTKKEKIKKINIKPQLRTYQFIQTVLVQYLESQKTYYSQTLKQRQFFKTTADKKTNRLDSREVEWLDPLIVRESNASHTPKEDDPSSPFFLSTRMKFNTLVKTKNSLFFSNNSYFLLNKINNKSFLSYWLLPITGLALITPTVSTNFVNFRFYNNLTNEISGLQNFANHTTLGIKDRALVRDAPSEDPNMNIQSLRGSVPAGAEFTNSQIPSLDPNFIKKTFNNLYNFIKFKNSLFKIKISSTEKETFNNSSMVLNLFTDSQKMVKLSKIDYGFPFSMLCVNKDRIHINYLNESINKSKKLNDQITKSHITKEEKSFVCHLIEDARQRLAHLLLTQNININQFIERYYDRASRTSARSTSLKNFTQSAPFFYSPRTKFNARLLALTETNVAVNPLDTKIILNSHLNFLSSKNGLKLFNIKFKNLKRKNSTEAIAPKLDYDIAFKLINFNLKTNIGAFKKNGTRSSLRDNSSVSEKEVQSRNEINHNFFANLAQSPLRFNPMCASKWHTIVKNFDDSTNLLLNNLIVSNQFKWNSANPSSFDPICNLKQFQNKNFLLLNYLFLKNPSEPLKFYSLSLVKDDVPQSKILGNVFAHKKQKNYLINLIKTHVFLIEDNRQRFDAIANAIGKSRQSINSLNPLAREPVSEKSKDHSLSGRFYFSKIEPSEIRSISKADLKVEDHSLKQNKIKAVHCIKVSKKLLDGSFKNYNKKNFKQINVEFRKTKLFQKSRKLDYNYLHYITNKLTKFIKLQPRISNNDLSSIDEKKGVANGNSTIIKPLLKISKGKVMNRPSYFVANFGRLNHSLSLLFKHYKIFKKPFSNLIANKNNMTISRKLDPLTRIVDQKKRKAKKQRLETRRQKKRTRFFPRPIWLRYNLFKNFISLSSAKNVNSFYSGAENSAYIPYHKEKNTAELFHKTKLFKQLNLRDLKNKANYSSQKLDQKNNNQPNQPAKEKDKGTIFRDFWIWTYNQIFPNFYEQYLWSFLPTNLKINNAFGSISEADIIVKDDWKILVRDLSQAKYTGVLNHYSSRSYSAKSNRSADYKSYSLKTKNFKQIKAGTYYLRATQLNNLKFARYRVISQARSSTRARCSNKTSLSFHFIHQLKNLLTITKLNWALHKTNNTSFTDYNYRYTLWNQQKLRNQSKNNKTKALEKQSKQLLQDLYSFDYKLDSLKSKPSLSMSDTNFKIFNRLRLSKNQKKQKLNYIVSFNRVPLDRRCSSEAGAHLLSANSKLNFYKTINFKIQNIKQFHISWWSKLNVQKSLNDTHFNNYVRVLAPATDFGLKETCWQTTISKYNNLFITSSLLFHMCALITLVSISQIRCFVKFHLILLYKLKNLYSLVIHESLIKNIISSLNPSLNSKTKKSNLKLKSLLSAEDGVKSPQLIRSDRSVATILRGKISKEKLFTLNNSKKEGSPTSNEYFQLSDTRKPSKRLNPNKINYSKFTIISLKSDLLKQMSFTNKDQKAQARSSSFVEFCFTKLDTLTIRGSSDGASRMSARSTSTRNSIDNDGVSFEQTISLPQAKSKDRLDSRAIEVRQPLTSIFDQVAHDNLFIRASRMLDQRYSSEVRQQVAHDRGTQYQNKTLKDLTKRLKYAQNKLTLKINLNRLSKFRTEILEKSLLNFISLFQQSVRSFSISSLNPAEVTTTWIANGFLIEWSSDLITIIPENVDMYLLSLRTKLSRTLVHTIGLSTNFYGGNVINQYLPSSNEYFLSTLSLSKIKNLILLNNINLTFILSYLITRLSANNLLKTLIFTISQPDADLISRQRKGILFWDIWADFLVTAADYYKKDIATLSTIKTEQNLLISQISNDRACEMLYPEDQQILSQISSLNPLVVRESNASHSSFILDYRGAPASGLQTNFNQVKQINQVFGPKKMDLSTSKVNLQLVHSSASKKLDIPSSSLMNSVLQSSNKSFRANFFGDNLNRWSINQYMTYQSWQSHNGSNNSNGDLFLDYHPPKTFMHLSTIKYNSLLQQPIGNLVCQIYSGIFEHKISKNVLLINPSTSELLNTEKQINRVPLAGAPNQYKIYVSALAGETELKMVTDNAQRYSLINRGFAIGIKLLRDVFDAIALNTPCIFLLEDIHAIGERRPMLISDSSSNNTSDSNSFKEDFFGSQRDEIHEKNLVVYQLTRHAITHYKKPFKGDFSSAIPTNLFISDLFLQSLSSKHSLESIGNLSLVSAGKTLSQKIKISNKKDRSMSGQQLKTSFLRISRHTNNLAPPSTSPFSILLLKEEKKLKQNKIVDELPWRGLPNEQLVTKPRTSYSIRAKVAMLAELALSNLSAKLDMITDLLVIIDSVRSHKGFVVFATTNVPQILDPALRRPGRLDETIYLSNINSSNALKLTTNFEIIKSIKPTNLIMLEPADAEYKYHKMIKNNSFLTINLKDFQIFLNIKNKAKNKYSNLVFSSENSDLNYSLISHAFKAYLRKLTISSGDLLTTQPSNKKREKISSKNQEITLKQKFIGLNQVKYARESRQSLDFALAGDNALNKVKWNISHARSKTLVRGFSTLNKYKSIVYYQVGKVVLNYYLTNKFYDNLKQVYRVGKQVEDESDFLNLKSINYLSLSGMFESADFLTSPSDKESEKSHLPLNSNKYLRSSISDHKNLPNNYSNLDNKLLIILMLLFGGQISQFLSSKQKLSLDASHSPFIFDDITSTPRHSTLRSSKKFSGPFANQPVPQDSNQLRSQLEIRSNRKQMFFSKLKQFTNLNLDMSQVFFTTEHSAIKLATTLILGFIQKRYLYGKNLIVPKLLSFIDYSIKEEPPSPPFSSLLIPAKKFENYQRVFYDSIVGNQMGQRKAQITFAEKLQIHSSLSQSYEKLRKMTQLKKLETKQAETNELVNSLSMMESGQNDSQSKENQIKIMTMGLNTNILSDTMLQTTTNINWYYQNRILKRHGQYLTNQWWNGQLSEHNAETVFLSDIDWRSSTISNPANALSALRSDLTDKDSLISSFNQRVLNIQKYSNPYITLLRNNKKQNNKNSYSNGVSLPEFPEMTGLDVLLDFPDTDQYYNPRRRRWLLTKESWDFWFNFDKIYSEKILVSWILESIIRTYTYLHNTTELLDFITTKFMNLGYVQTESSMSSDSLTINNKHAQPSEDERSDLNSLTLTENHKANSKLSINNNLASYLQTELNSVKEIFVKNTFKRF